jgi:hypothetical protein
VKRLVEMITAADCLANTGVDLPLVGGSIAIALIVLGLAVLLRVRRLRGRIALAVVPLLLLAALFAGSPAPAQAAVDCPPASSESTSAPISTATPTPTPEPTSTGIAPLFVIADGGDVYNFQFFYDCQVLESGTAFPVATGTEPITYSSGVLPGGISLDSATGAITVNRAEYVEGNGLSEVVVDVTATNNFGSDEASFTLRMQNLFPGC